MRQATAPSTPPVKARKDPLLGGYQRRAARASPAVFAPVSSFTKNVRSRNALETADREDEPHETGRLPPGSGRPRCEAKQRKEPAMIAKRGRAVIGIVGLFALTVLLNSASALAADAPPD